MINVTTNNIRKYLPCTLERLKQAMVGCDRHGDRLQLLLLTMERKRQIRKQDTVETVNDVEVHKVMYKLGERP